MCEPFGPQAVAEGFVTIGLPSRIGVLNAIATDNLADADRVVVFIPGFTGSKEDFIEFLPVLKDVMQDAGHVALVAYSQRGQADSAVPDDGSSYTLDDFVSDGCKVLRALGGGRRPIDLVGHSFGGVVARRVAIRESGWIRSLTLFSTGSKPVAKSEDSLKGVGLLRRYGTSVIFKGSYPDRADEPQPEPDVEMFRLRAHATDVNNVLSIANILGSYGDVTEDLRRTAIPVLSVHGADDDVWPADVYDDEARELHAKSVSIPGAGHSAQLDQPRELARVLVNFWCSLPGERQTVRER
ncbi:alpha/beta hydrolase [Bifidobacterium sp. ESL0764]|uniref:alpha/beta fold hydrolase n=1 Tax=Bifidobacterium sp. ESL0764 TaxID=2983228 RepID=UPI0023F6D608|nr:alpha/beta hydrolase [Bifidobacterium sp. ESL0764]WEV65210.1 alpha/beta hydrolase [Bifidobacterium sp. ESL0764]